MNRQTTTDKAAQLGLFDPPAPPPVQPPEPVAVPIVATRPFADLGRVDWLSGYVEGRKE